MPEQANIGDEDDHVNLRKPKWRKLFSTLTVVRGVPRLQGNVEAG